MNEDLHAALSTGTPRLPVHTGPSPWDTDQPAPAMFEEAREADDVAGYPGADTLFDDPPYGTFSDLEAEAAISENTAAPSDGGSSIEGRPVLARHLPLVLAVTLLACLSLVSWPWTVLPLAYRLALAALAVITVIAIAAKGRPGLALATGAATGATIASGEHATWLAAPVLLSLAGIASLRAVR